MKQEKRVSKHLLINLWIPMVLVMILVITATMIVQYRDAAIYGYVLYMIALCYTIISVIQYQKMAKAISGEIISSEFEKNKVQRSLIEDMPIPYVLTDSRGEILLYNTRFQEILGKKNKKDISQIFKGIHKKVFPQGPQAREYHVSKEDKHYRVICQRIMIGDIMSEEDKMTSEGKNHTEESVLAFYLFDETELAGYKEDFRNKRVVAGLIYIDNYEEVLESMEEVRQALLLALVERKILRYMQDFDAIVKKFSNDKFLFIFEEKNLDKMLESRFSIMDDVREVSVGNELAMTLSIGVGLNAPTLPETYESARIAMDLALGRGGDQAVVRDGDSVSYYGGKSQQVEKSTRVKARVKAHALREMMLSHEQIFIMGHKNPDADCVGAALGVYRIARIFGKKAYIVMEEDCPNIAPIVEQVHNDLEGGEERVFVSNEQAAEIADQSTMTVVVDVNIPHMTEYPDLLHRTKNVVVFDHHRQTSDTIRNAVLSYVEPYASSTCEMIAEILQYVADKPKLRPVEADALYSGILVDTDNFVIRAGVRTFEAAAFLRRAGADVTRVRKMFAEDLEEFRHRNSIVNRAEVFMDEFMISTFDGREVPGATVIGAKAANALLDIRGVRGSFVVTRQPGYIYISGRSINDLNVQIIMERLGGGGHLTVAATQLKDVTMEEAVSQLKQVLADMKNDGEI